MGSTPIASTNRNAVEPSELDVISSDSGGLFVCRKVDRNVLIGAGLAVGDLPADILMLDGIAVAAGVGFAVPALAFDALLVLAAAAGKAVVGDQAQLVLGGFFAGHKRTILKKLLLQLLIEQNCAIL